MILDAYSMKDHIDGLVTRPSQFLLDAVGSPTLDLGDQSGFQSLATKRQGSSHIDLLYSYSINLTNGGRFGQCSRGLGNIGRKVHL